MFKVYKDDEDRTCRDYRIKFQVDSLSADLVGPKWNRTLRWTNESGMFGRAKLYYKQACDYCDTANQLLKAGMKVENILEVLNEEIPDWSKAWSI